MRELTRNTKAVVEKVVRSGRPVVITMYGRPQVAVTPLVAAVETPPEPLVLEGAPADIQEAIRASEADLISGRAKAMDDSVFEDLEEDDEPVVEQARAELASHVAPLVHAIRLAPGKPDAVNDVREALMQVRVLAVGRPAGDTSIPGSGTESELVTYTAGGDGGGGPMLPVFTNLDVLRTALWSNEEWQTLEILELNGRDLVESVDPDLTIVIDPWSPLEFHIPPTESRRVGAQPQPVMAAAQLMNA